MNKSNDIVEAAGGGEITGQYAPTNDLLTPEYEPRTTHKERRGKETKLSDLGRPVPGQSPVAEPEGETSENRMVFEPKDVAERIIRGKFGRVTAPEKKGTLFDRDQSGKPVIKGMDTPDVAKARRDNSTKVREILKTI